LVMTNSTVSNNSANESGGILNSGTATIKYSTIANNIATGFGGGLISSGPATLTANVIAGNSGTVDCQGFSITDGGYNVIQSTNTGFQCGLTDGVNGNRIGVDPLLGPLQNNGGDTPTRAPGVGSPATNLIPNGTAGCGTTVTTDQRGMVRPFGS